MKMMMIKLSEVKQEFNPRSDFSKVKEIADSIEKLGLLQPIVVRGNGSGFVLVDGACRLQALKDLKQTETQAIVIDAGSADEAQLAANLMRADLNVLEKARGYERMIRLFPGKYNETMISKTFGTPISKVKQMVSIAKRIPAKLDAEISGFVGMIDLEDLGIIAQVPDLIKVKLAKQTAADGGNCSWALGKLAKQLDFGGDAVNTGALVSAGKAFSVRWNHGNETVYTLDAEVYKTAKELYEKQMKERNKSARYGEVEKKGKAKTEKQIEADRKSKAKDKADRIAAAKELPALFKKFIGEPVNENERHAMAKEIFEHHVDSDKCRRLWAAFGIAGCQKVSIYELRGKTYDVVIKPYITTTFAAAKLLSFVKMGWDQKLTPEQAWVKGMKK